MSEKTRKQDRRTRYTRQTIKDTFLELLKQKSFTKITVTEVCKNAEINRGTFSSSAKISGTLKIWFADEEFPASGKLFLQDHADHYLSVEDAVTVGEILLQKLSEAFSSL